MTRERGVSRRIATAALAVLALASAGIAGTGEHTRVLPKSRIDLRATCPWPTGVNKGWIPIEIALRNDGASARNVQIQLLVWGGNVQGRSSQRVALEPGESARLELLAPISQDFYNCNVTITAGEDREGFSIGGGAGSAPRVQAVLAIGPEAVKPGTVERWTAEISTAMARPHYGGAAPSNDNFGFGFARFDELPSSPVAYSSLDLAVLDASDGWPHAGELAALLAWVRTGGTLLVSGEGARAACEAEPELAAWMEPRFEGARGGGDPTYAVALGTLAVLDDPGFLESDRVRDLVRRLADQDHGTVPDPGGSRTNHVRPVIADLGQIPYKVFALLLVLFALAIGPVNFVWVARSRRPMRLLLTIPAIALATSLALFAYGIFFQGLDVKTASVSVAVLDQRAHRSACVEKRLMFAGLAPSDGLRPEPGTTVAVVTDPGSTSYSARHEHVLEVERDAELVLGGDFLPTRSATTQVLSTERAERARLEVARGGGGGLEVSNHLGAEILALVLRDPQGNAFSLREPLAPGASAALDPLDPAVGLERAATVLRQGIDPWPGARDLPPGCYAARLASGPFRDACGIETHEVAADHRLVGVLALDEEAWQ
jgi:hypothetical protein